MRKIHLISLILCALFALPLSAAGAAPTKPDLPSDYACASALRSLGLAKGYDDTGTNFGLSDKMTRVQTVVQIIRFLGTENTVLKGDYSHPFCDVPDWAKNYVGYAYQNGITAGRSATAFDPDGEVSEAQFLTFMLRAVGYSDASGDFSWDAPFALSKKVGLIASETPSAAFCRGDAFRISFDTLYATAKNGKTAAENLTDRGVISSLKLNRAVETAKTAVAPTASPTEARETLPAPEAASDYYVLSAKDYTDKTTAGFLSQIIGFLSDYKYVWAKNGAPRCALPDEWWLGICRGNDVAGNPYHQKIIKLYYNEETQMYEDWIADAFSIDILGQHILRDMRNEHGTITTKTVTDGWLKYVPWDMGGGQHFAGAYYLANTKGYISPYLGMAEYGNKYSWCQEPWIGNDGLGMAAAGMPNLARELTGIFGRVTGDSDNVRWLDFVATMSSMAYFESDIPTLIRRAEEIFPEDSYEHEVVEMCFALYQKYPYSWRSAIVQAEKQCARRFYYLYSGKSTNEQGRVEVNMAFMILSMLYGKGDYMQTAKYLSLSGYDTRGTLMLPILGIIGGMDVIPEEALAVTWQDGKGEIVNKAVPDTVNGVWMFAENLPERYTIASVIELYRENFEWLLVQNGGKIENGYYYIPKTAMLVKDAVPVKNGNFETGKPDGFTATGTASASAITTDSYWGEYGMRVLADAAVENGVYTTVSGLIPGERYRVSAYICTAGGAEAHLYAESAGKTSFATVRGQNEFVLRDLVFTANASTAKIGFAVQKQNAEGSAVVDEITVTRVKEYALPGVGKVSMASNGEGIYRFTVSGKAEKQVYLKLKFENTTSMILDAKVTVNGEPFGTVPLYKTAKTAVSSEADCIYIPILLKNAENTVLFETRSSTLRITAAEIVTTEDKLLRK